MRRAPFGSIGLAWVLAFLATARERAWAGDESQAEFFESRVRPVLATRCFECHGEKKQKGGLRLDSSQAMRAGGDTGPAIVADDPTHSPLIEAIRHEGAVKMPPRGKLEAAEIDALTEWVKRGAPWPAAEGPVRPQAASPGQAISEADRDFWAFRPVRDVPPPAVSRAGWPKSSVDPFILAKLEEKGLQPSPPADKRTLLRRASFDLIGLPPTPEEVESFVRDESPEAFARVVERLLASPHYGERWGRHWLDVARYGEDQAHSFQPRLYPNGFRYRDWVADALNRDMPYDRFILEQVAGDLLDEPGRIERLAALGFFALGPVYYGDPKKFDQVDDRIDTMARGFLGLTVACARCHDHKYDPIPTSDYYSLAGVFLSTEYEEAPAAPERQVRAYDAAQAAIDGKARQIEALLRSCSANARAAESVRYLVAALELRAVRSGEGRPTSRDVAKREGLESGRLDRWASLLERSKDQPRVAELLRAAGPAAGKADDESKRAVAHAAEAFRKHVEAVLASQDAGRPVDAADGTLVGALFDGKGPLALNKDRVEKDLPPEARARLVSLRSEEARLRQEAPPKYPVVHTLKDAAKPADASVLVRGNPATPGPKVPRHFLSILGGSTPFASGSGRLELARAIASPDNPLTARVMVNRIWHHHFGRGLVRTTSNFGNLGERPSHPELLDLLARRFIDGGWSMKALHREILLSATYQQASRADARAEEVDPENVLLSRMNRRRLEVEAWRDAVLAVSGRLDPEIGGPSRSLDDPGNRRRTCYAAVSRHDLAALLRLFDFPDPNITGAERTRTTVPLQGLVVLNDELLVDGALALAARVRASAADDDARIRAAYALLFGRPATDQERRIGRDYLAAPEPEGATPGGLSRWDRYAQALLATNEFVFID
ncbi:Planctomycete cytochrome C [Aquisphaera giovannonii]|uniref:Planctomycete cytochrome C n=1 Tax=Aquisphaera giovannonii TaxID=406548 RepID=A0A5B9WDJ1_9BACT|nr:PSD1 and planctomycete cytochrome C domain-containing protein [Aquisphaera giovannonii]QEH38135.1 Planctomycete cytochrome C [Aquisphaera giovannonii]